MCVGEGESGRSWSLEISKVQIQKLEIFRDSSAKSSVYNAVQQYMTSNHNSVYTNFLKIICWFLFKNSWLHCSIPSNLLLHFREIIVALEIYLLKFKMLINKKNLNVISVIKKWKPNNLFYQGFCFLVRIKLFK